MCLWCICTVHIYVLSLCAMFDRVILIDAQVVAGSYATYLLHCDGSVSSVGEGSYGRLGHGGAESETEAKVIEGLKGKVSGELVILRHP